VCCGSQRQIVEKYSFTRKHSIAQYFGEQHRTAYQYELISTNDDNVFYEAQQAAALRLLTSGKVLDNSECRMWNNVVGMSDDCHASSTSTVDYANASSFVPSRAAAYGSISCHAPSATTTTTSTTTTCSSSSSSSSSSSYCSLESIDRSKALFQPLIDKDSNQYAPTSTSAATDDASAASHCSFFDDLAKHSHIWLADSEGSADLLPPFQAAALVDQGICGMHMPPTHTLALECH
jgi:hypothetical protein